MVQASAAIIVLVYINFGCLTGSATGAGPLAVCLGGKWEGGRGGGWDGNVHHPDSVVAGGCGGIVAMVMHCHLCLVS